MAKKKNLSIDRAATQTINLTVRSASQQEISTGDKIYFTVKEKYDDDTTDSAALIAKTMNAEDVLDPETGVATFTITAAEANIPAGKYVYDLVFKQSDGERIPLLIGKLTVGPAVTLREIE